MSRIGIIIPYQKLYYDTSMILNDTRDIEVKVGLLNDSIDVARELVKNGAEVLISRGGTSSYLKKEFDTIPVVDIEISSYDIADAIVQAKKYDNNIALIIFQSMLYEDVKLPYLFDCNIKTYYIQKEEQAYDVVYQALEEGYTTFLGGRILTKVCNELGIRNFLITSGPNSMLAAIRQAQQILKTKDESIRNLNLINDVIQNTFIGIVAVNESNGVKIANNRAIELMNKTKQQVIGSNIYELLQIKENIEDGNIVIELNGSKIVVNKKSRHIRSIDIASIFTLEKTSDISEKERNIRKLYVDKGHKAKYSFNDIKGKSTVLREIKEIAKRYALVDSTILISGETGTGKEMFAQSIHNHSLRKSGPFVAVNCAAITESLLESELFGYAKGAFTGASSFGKEGIFEMANGGTIFLDEISEVSPTIQAKLLRVIQEREVMRIGDNNIIPIDVRIIVATNKDLQSLVYDGKFRIDLYYRLNTLQLNIPPLRDRKGDLNLLIDDFLNYYTLSLRREKPIIDKRCYDILCKHKWIGNIRELKNIVERLIITFDEKIILPEMIYKVLKVEESTSLEEIDIDVVLRVLESNHNNKTQTAKDLGIGRTTLYKLLKEKDNIILK
jgi:transcriptional regulator with PAS, ATPase and Fis domain